MELLAALASLAVIISFASAPLERMSARVDVDIARENVEHLLQVASRSAAIHKLPVIISVSEKLGRAHFEATYSYRWRSLRLEHIPSYSLPKDVVAVMGDGMTTIELGRDGLADEAQPIRIYSLVNPEYIVDVTVEGLDTAESRLYALNAQSAGD